VKAPIVKPLLKLLLVLLVANFGLTAMVTAQPTEPCPVCGSPLPWDVDTCGSCGTTFELEDIPELDPPRRTDPFAPDPIRPTPVRPNPNRNGGDRPRPFTPDELGAQDRPDPGPRPRLNDDELDYGYSLMRVESPQFLPPEAYRMVAGFDHESGNHLTSIGRYWKGSDITQTVLTARFEYGLYHHALLHAQIPFHMVEESIPSIGAESSSGPGDLLLGLRWNLMLKPDFSLGADLSIPTGEEAENRGRASQAFRTIATFSEVYDNFSLHWNLGLILGRVERTFDDGTTLEDRIITERTFQFGMAVQYPWREYRPFIELLAEYEDFGPRTWLNNQQFENFLVYLGPGIRWRRESGQHVTVGILKGMSSQSQNFSFHVRIGFEF